ncbi:unnamed protein product, partial [Ectocarpus sp. 13 AM-2016]
ADDQDRWSQGLAEEQELRRDIETLGLHGEHAQSVVLHEPAVSERGNDHGEERAGPHGANL